MKGICFTEPLFHKVVKGEKTQTRRGATHQHFSYSELSNVKQGVYIHPAIPKYKVGEKVYLKEPYSIIADYEKGLITKYKFDYPASFSHKWSNKLFMPESAARYFIEITAVRAERLQDITEEDCIKEGIEYSPEAVPIGYPFGAEFPYNNGFHNYTTAKEAYAALINKINGKGTWEKTPFVWVYDFRLMDLCK